MTVTSLNHGASRSYALQLSGRELAIVIAALDYTTAGIEETGTIPDTMVPRSAQNKSDPEESEFARAVVDARLMQDKLTAVLPHWKDGL